MRISFSPPDITEEEIQEVADTLKSGWITTGPKTKKFEKEIADFCSTNKAVCLNSATAGLELVLRILGVGKGDEVITSAYTYTASASVVEHVGAKLVLCDVAKDSYQMDYDKLPSLITKKTKVIIPVDIAGVMANYDKVFEIVEANKAKFVPNNDVQKSFGRIIVLADGAHSFGAKQNGVMSGNRADFTSFSFHAVKNLTTAEGGAVTWTKNNLDDEWLYKQFMLWSLHGQNKDALAKTQIGAWEYDIAMCGQKCNMTDIMASIGLVQLKRYPNILARRQQIIDRYTTALKDLDVDILCHKGENFVGSGHLFLVRLNGADVEKRNLFITKMAEKEVATNVHYKPLPMHTAYKNMGFDIKNFPNAFNQYQNEITLPLHTLLTDEMVEFVIKTFVDTYKEIM